MILDKEVFIKVNARTVPHFRSLGYITGKNKMLKVNTSDLNSGSHFRINVSCDCCNHQHRIEYRQYIKKIEFDGKYYCRENKCFTQKVKLSTIEKYGVSNTSKLMEKQNKWKSTNMERYGVENVFQSEEKKEKIKASQIQRGMRVPDENSYKKYRNRASYKCKLRAKEIIKNWDGKDFYDGEYIRDNFNLHFNDAQYPTIDHKISVLYGYLNNIPIEEICDINNLCLTKRSINSKKKSKNKFGI